MDGTDRMFSTGCLWIAMAGFCLIAFRDVELNSPMLTGAFHVSLVIGSLVGSVVLVFLVELAPVIVPVVTKRVAKWAKELEDE